MTEEQRLIEVAFPLKQTSLDSVHEKNVRHGHISTLHIWPARRPLAAMPRRSHRYVTARSRQRRGTQANLRATRRSSSFHVSSRRNSRMAGLRNRQAKRRRAASCTGDAKAAQTSTGSARKSEQPMVGVPPNFLIPSRAAALFPWKRCAWAVM